MLKLADRYGLVTLQTTIYVPTSNRNAIEIGGTMPTNIGVIFGIATLIDQVTPDGNNLITSTESSQLYLELKRGNSDFIEDWRLDQLVFVDSANNVFGNNQRFQPVIIPGNISLDKSRILNPVPVASNNYVALVFFYLTMEDIIWLEDKMRAEYNIPRNEAVFPNNFTRRDSLDYNRNQ